jgi:hypothetical protein
MLTDWAGWEELIIVRLLIPSINPPSAATTHHATQAHQARASLTQQDREHAAVKVHVNTSAPQTPYSTPQVVVSCALGPVVCPL